MKNWSAEELIVRTYAAVASGVQAVLDAVSTLERITRPLTHDFDEPLAEEFLRDGAEQLAEREAEEECWEPGDPRLRCAAAASVNGDPFLCELPSVHTHSAHSNTHYRTYWTGPGDSRVAVDELFAAGENDGPSPLDSTLDDVVAQLAQLTYFIEDIRNLLVQWSTDRTSALSSDTFFNITPM